MSEEQAEEIAGQPGLLSPDNPNVGPAPCPVVGLGASAGGLEAFQNFLATAPNDAGLAYVLVQHLNPNHESMRFDTMLPVKFSYGFYDAIPFRDCRKAACCTSGAYRPATCL